MPEQTLLEYIQNAIQAGYTPEQLRKVLASYYPEETINAALAGSQKKHKPVLVIAIAMILIVIAGTFGALTYFKMAASAELKYLTNPEEASSNEFALKESVITESAATIDEEFFEPEELQLDEVPIEQSSESIHEITIQNNAFAPAQLTIPSGATVRWANKDRVPHSIETSAFDSSGILAIGDTFTHTFENPGTYEYTCGVHPSMKGEIIVS